MDPFIWPALALALSVSGQPLQAELLQSERPACHQRDSAAASWRTAGRPVHVHRVGPWCVAASLHEGHWEAEQWADSPERKAGAPASHGWRVRLPLREFPEPNPYEMRFGLDPQGSDMTVLPTSFTSLTLAHRDIRRRHGLRSDDRAADEAAAEPPFLISQASQAGQRLTLITVRSEMGELVHVVLRERRP